MSRIDAIETASFDELVKLAETDPAAQFALAQRYLTGTDVAKDRITGIAWLRRAAQADYFDAILELGRVYDTRTESTFQPEEALYWYRKAADRGSPYAWYCLGTIYCEGFAIPRNDEEAIRCFRISATMRPPGFSVAQHSVGVCYQTGRGVPKDEGKAVEWFRKAAEQGFRNAEYDLAVCYRTGKGVDRDLNVAADLYERAAEQGFAKAQNDLGICFMRGVGRPVDRIRAYQWLTLADEAGIESSGEFRAEIAVRLSEAEIQEAQLLCAAYKARNVLRVGLGKSNQPIAPPESDDLPDSASGKIKVEDILQTMTPEEMALFANGCRSLLAIEMMVRMSLGASQNEHGITTPLGAIAFDRHILAAAVGCCIHEQGRYAAMSDISYPTDEKVWPAREKPQSA